MTAFVHNAGLTHGRLFRIAQARVSGRPGTSIVTRDIWLEHLTLEMLKIVFPTCYIPQALATADRAPILLALSMSTGFESMRIVAADKPRVSRTRKTRAKAPKTPAPDDASAPSADDELHRLHQELMQQIEERKKAQKTLASALNTSAAVTASPPASAAAPPTPATSPAELVFPAPPARSPAAATPDPVAPAAPAVTTPPRHPDAMNIIVVSAECAPWSKTGGLGDVAGALPKALAARGHRVMVVAPRYGAYEDAWETGVRQRMRVYNQEQEVGYFHCYVDGVDHVFVDHPSFMAFGNDIYGGNRQDIQFRCALLCKAALEAPWVVPCGGSPYGDESLVFVANDWHTALLPVYLQAHYRDHGKLSYARSVFVLHNIAHQGRGPMDDLHNLEIPEQYTELFRLYDPVGGEHMNVMKAGMTTAHRMVAVSHGYAWECQTQEGGWGLDGVVRENAWKLRGVVNGIDTQDWNPSVDVHLTSDGYKQYDITTLKAGKAACKAALQKELGLPVNPDVPLLGFIGRLDYQKGVDLIRDNYEWLMQEGAQLVMLGSGREDLESALRDMEARNHDKCRGWVGFSVKMAHRITAGADILLMPSRFEPCGLNQLYAMEYGTVPVVHAVGGLRDTVQPFNPFDNVGTGWTFERAEAWAFQKAMGDALYTYREHRESFEGLQKRGMQQDLSWEHAAELYEEVLLQAKYQW